MKIAPSILSANFGHLQQDIDKVSNADVLHVDVMDGHFVPNITIGPVVLKDVKTNLHIEAHLMINEPEKFAAEFVKAGAKTIIFHSETVKEPKRMIDLIHSLGAQAGISINPDTPASNIFSYLSDVDMVLVMSVFPGFAGQKFIDSVLPKIKEIRSKFKKDIEVDGGINEKTAVLCAKAGANVFVAGSYIFGAKNPSAKIDELRKALENF